MIIGFKQDSFSQWIPCEHWTVQDLLVQLGGNVKAVFSDLWIDERDPTVIRVDWKADPRWNMAWRFETQLQAAISLKLLQAAQLKTLRAFERLSEEEKDKVMA